MLLGYPVVDIQFSCDLRTIQRLDTAGIQDPVVSKTGKEHY